MGLDRRRRCCCWCCCLLPFLVKNYRVFQFNLVMVYAIAVLGLNILTGFNGQFSLGHGAFYAIGAYTGRHPDGPGGHAVLGHAAGGGHRLLRVRLPDGVPGAAAEGHFLALATFALALAVPQLLKYKQIEGLDRRRAGHRADKPEPPFTFRSSTSP
jgi:branched-chain amino acid transport system permease protein